MEESEKTSKKRSTKKYRESNVQEESIGFYFCVRLRIICDFLFGLLHTTEYNKFVLSSAFMSCLVPTKQSACQNIYFIFRPYLFQNKYVPHTNNSRPPRGPTAPYNLETCDLYRGAPQFGDRLCCVMTLISRTFWHDCTSFVKLHRNVGSRMYGKERPAADLLIEKVNYTALVLRIVISYFYFYIDGVHTTECCLL
jgi:hypothetical protein